MIYTLLVFSITIIMFFQDYFVISLVHIVHEAMTKNSATAETARDADVAVHSPSLYYNVA